MPSPSPSLAERARGARRSRRGIERSAPSMAFPPPPRRWSKRSVPATPSPSPPRRVSEASALFARPPSPAPPGFSPSPLPRSLRNAVTLVEKLPMIVTNNQLGRGTGEKGDKVSTVILPFVSFAPVVFHLISSLFLFSYHTEKQITLAQGNGAG